MADLIQLTPYAFPLIVTAFLTVFLGVKTWRNRPRRGSVPFFLMMCLVTFWLLGYSLQLTVVRESHKIFFSNLEYLAVMFLPVGWLWFTLEYSNREKWISIRNLVTLSVIPAVFLVLTWTNKYHEWMRAETTTEKLGGYWVLDTTLGIGSIPSSVYSYLLILVGILFLIGMFINSRYLYRGQVAAILAGVSVPSIMGIMYLVGFRPLKIDLTPLGFAFTGVCIWIALFRYSFLDIAPVARDRMLEEMEDLVIVVDKENRIVDLNPASRKIANKDDPVGENLVEVFSFGDRLVEEIDKYRLKDGKKEGENSSQDRQENGVIGVSEASYSYSYEEESSESRIEIGEKRYFDPQVSTVSGGGDGGDLKGYMVVLRDITQKRRRKKELEFYEMLFENVRDKVYAVNSDGYVTMVNDPLASMIGYSREEIEGMHLSEFVGEEGVERASRIVDEIWEDDEGNESFEFELMTADGEKIPCEIEMSLIPHEDDYNGVVGVVRDISKRKKAEKELKRTEIRLETLVDASPLAIIATNRDRKVESWNPAAEKFFGWSSEEAHQKPIKDLIRPEDDDYFDSAVDDVLEGESVTGLEISCQSKDGSWIDTSISGAPLDDDGVVEGIVLIISDITERKEREQRAEVLNRVLRHNLRNDMNVITGYADFILSQTTDEEIENEAAQIKETGENLFQLGQKARDIENMLKGKRKTEVMDIKKVVEEEVENTKSEYGENIEVIFENRCEEGIEVEADEMIVPAIGEIIENAVEHGSPSNQTPSDNTVENGTESDANDVVVKLDMVSGEKKWVQISVEDNGSGIPRHEKEVLLEGTETPLRHGSGLGLWLVNWAVNRSGGELGFEEGEEGSKVVIRLPVSTLPSRE